MLSLGFQQFGQAVYTFSDVGLVVVGEAQTQAIFIISGAGEDFAGLEADAEIEGFFAYFCGVDS